MEKIRKYIEKFFKRHEKNVRYDMKLYEIFLLERFASENRNAAFATTFDYGYVKGYKAALAELRKGGVA